MMFVMSTPHQRDRRRDDLGAGEGHARLRWPDDMPRHSVDAPRGRQSPAAGDVTSSGASRTLVTVIVPAFDAAATLQATLASISAQTHSQLEILVVDDGSSDATANVARRAAAGDSRIRLLQKANGGVARARNAALAEAQGRYVSYIDADDLWHREKIASQLATFAAARQPPSFVYSGYRLIDEDNRILPNYRPLTNVSGPTICRQIATNFFSNVSSIMVPTDLARAVGGHDPRLRDEGIEGAEDLLMQLRLAALGPAECCPRALVGYRMHDTNMSRCPLRSAKSNLRALDLIEQEQPTIVTEVFRLGRARVIGYLPMLLGARRYEAAWWLFSRLISGQHRRTVEMMGRMAVTGPRLVARSKHTDSALGARFVDADPDSISWQPHAFLTRRRRAWLETQDAIFAARHDLLRAPRTKLADRGAPVAR